MAMLSDRPAHSLMASVSFGGAVASAAWLLPVGRPLEHDPLMLPVITAAGSVAGAMLLYAIGWRLVAAFTSTLILACFAAVHLRVQRGSWSGPPLLLFPTVLLTIKSWIPRARPREQVAPAGSSAGTRTHLLQPSGWDEPAPQITTVWQQSTPHALTADSDRLTGPQLITRQLNKRWAVLGSRRLPGAAASGHSQVHLALDTWNKNRQAVAKLPGGPDPDQSQARLAREARLLLAAGRNPHVVALLDSGHDRWSGIFYLILAYHRQGSLARLLTSVSDFELSWAAHVTRGILIGLIGLQEHAGGPIVHRDLNPRNVLLLDDRTTPVLCDLGMARRVPTDYEDDLVTTGQVYSPWHGAPELVHGRTAWGLAVDSYGVGAILYELVTGQPPLRRESLQLGGDFAALIHAGVLPASTGDLNAKLPARLIDLIDRCLAADPADRPPTAEDLLRELEQAIHGVTDQAVPFGALCRWNGPTRLRSA